MLCGLVFRCFVGRAIKPEMKQICLAGTNPKKYAMIQSADQYGDYQSAFDMLATAKAMWKIGVDLTDLSARFNNPILSYTSAKGVCLGISTILQSCR